jgi:hypothetical protein
MSSRRFLAAVQAAGRGVVLVPPSARNSFGYLLAPHDSTLPGITPWDRPETIRLTNGHAGKTIQDAGTMASPRLEGFRMLTVVQRRRR